MGFLKQQQEIAPNGRGDVYWNRAGRDSAPFRGPRVPMLRDEEFEEFAERVYDTKSATFDTTLPEQVIHGRTYHQILDAAMAGWFKIIARQHMPSEGKDGNPKMFVYVEWAEVYMEIDGNRLTSISGGVTGDNRPNSHKKSP